MLQVTEPVQESSTTAAWSSLKRIAFRFLFLYLVLSTWFWIFEFSDRSTALAGRPYIAIWRPMVRWVAVHLFGWGAPIELNFVHDTRYLYAQIACFLIVTAIVTVAWSSTGRNREQALYDKLYGWTRIFLRYTLAYLMLHYGMDKVFLIQFPAPTPTRLMEPFGNYSPSSLMWAFIGSSVPYTVFGGLAEIAGALLLLGRKTTLLGALLVFAVMLNVTVMDFSYDVSVKLFCLNLLSMAAFLIAPDASRLLNFFVLNRDTKSYAGETARFSREKQRVVGVVKTLVVLYLIVPITLRDWKNYRDASQVARENDAGIHGLYDVTDFSINGESHPALLADASRWRFLVLDSANVLTIKHMDESIASYPMVYDAATHQMRLLGSDSKNAGLLTVNNDSPEQTSFVGSVDGASVKAVTHRFDRSSFPLVSRGFHWINENSYIR